MAKKHFNYLGPALKEHVNTKLAQITERFGKHILSLDVRVAQSCFLLKSRGSTHKKRSDKRAFSFESRVEYLLLLCFESHDPKSDMRLKFVRFRKHYTSSLQNMFPGLTFDEVALEGSELRNMYVLQFTAKTGATF